MRAFALTCVLFASVGCADEEPRAPALGACPADDPNCVKPPVKGGGGGSSGAGGSGGGGGNTLPGQLSGTVFGVVAEDFVSAIPFIEPAVVEAIGPDDAPVVATYDGSSYSFDALPVVPQIWVRVAPTNVSSFLPTLQPVNTESQASADLLVVSAAVLDDIYVLASVPEVREFGRAHVVLRFVDLDSNSPLSGVSVTHQGETVLYDQQGTWSDLAGQTGALGYAVIVNAHAQAFTTKQQLQFQLGTVLAGAVDIAARADAVTLADVLVDTNP